MCETKHDSLMASAFAALALTFASFGDAFLYPFLPVKFTSVGVSVAWVGLLLSINRFVRIISNTLLVRAFAKYGLRSVMILSVAMAITSTFGYGLATGLLSWLLFRVVWGVAFSAMRIGTIGYALQQERKGRALGISKGLQEVGPMCSLFVGPVLLRCFEPRTIFFLLAGLSTPALYFALSLPNVDDKTQGLENRNPIRWPSTLNSITLVSALLIDGIMVVMLGVIFLHYGKSVTISTAITLSAFYLGYRKICFVVFAPAGGWIADKIGLARVFNISMALVVSGLSLILFGSISIGVVIVFTFYSINAAVTPASVSIHDTHSLAAVAENATWRDIGAAVGTLIGGFLISSQYLNTILCVAIFALILLLFFNLGPARKAVKLFYSWK